ncbi:MAG TPA: protein kinase family protein [Sulfurimonas sp.]|uniref:protein kinase family protein n=1 Tax=Sulfurimonas sp. TaxID=2022749 RepID=UPI002CC61C94|nr:protein kinase family protein [Sulfurimonas sp.]HUH43459.1 protein kinase family protein [Sulfurimonas sp.]
MNNKIIEFIKQRDFEFINELGNGAFGKTVLLQDNDINHKFVCKKYAPLKGIDKQKYYKNFINEIKLLHLLYHRNIVRIFNYYLYSEYYTGYIIMEYIQGNDIHSYIKRYPENLNSVFEQTIEGFNYLENNQILHRDIRPNNVLVNDDGIVKIIDFGFGKKINFSEDNQKSITINWWGNIIPDDFKNKVYDNTTEVYFIGKLFEEIILESNSFFKYKAILKKMIKVNPNDRINSFQDILKEINENVSIHDLFNDEERKIYQVIADYFTGSISSIELDKEVIMDIDNIINNLEHLQKRTMLEDYINPQHIFSIFFTGSYTMKYNYAYMRTDKLEDFIKLFKNITKEKQNIILYNLSTRIDDIDKHPSCSSEDIPF